MYDRPFGIYEKALRPSPWEKLFADVAAAGYPYFEISLDESDERLQRLEWGAGQIAEVRRAAAQNGVKVFSACFSGHRRFPLGSADPETERRAIHMLKQGIHLCAELDVRILQIAGYDVFYEPHSPDTARRYEQNLATGAQYAARFGVMLAIEPVEVFLTSVENTLEVVRRINSPWLQVYPDISNMESLGIDPLSQLERGVGHMVALHVRDSLPDFFYNVELGSGTIDFVSVFRKLDEIGYSGPLIVEMWNQEAPDCLQIITGARRFLLDKIALARQSG